ncbi:MAG: hypothetical protein QOH21_2049 [Acidobacteriota bacterium]|nr:hypothetical protein [Acidobacteriota bacterium]
MFESITAPSVSARLRNAAIPPIAAFLVAQAYVTFYPLLARVPAALFWAVALITGAGAVAGTVLIARVVRRERIRGVAIGWLVAAAGAVYLAGRVFLAMVMPWW